jgi:N-methylhydantoinase A/oxoprolinase/acetone carboxylase beta subunit
MAWQIGVDVGGTFTDLLAFDPERSVFRVAKVPSTPEDQSRSASSLGWPCSKPISPR